MLSVDSPSLLLAANTGVTPARRGVWAFLAIVLGVLAARWMNDAGADGAPVSPAACFGAVCLLSAIAGLLKWRAALVLLWGAAFFVGAGAWSLRIDHAPIDPVRELLATQSDLATRSRSGGGTTSADSIPITLLGVLRADPRVYASPVTWSDDAWTPGVFTRLELRVRSASDPGARPEPVSSGGRVSVVLQGRWSDARAGDLVRVTGELRPHPGPRFDGDTDFRPRHAQADELGVLLGEACERVSAGHQVVEDESMSQRAERAWLGALGTMRRAAHAGMMLSEEKLGASDNRAAARALIAAMLLGDQSAELAPINESFARLGLIHALSISGFHMALLAGLTLLTLRLIADFGRSEYLIVGAVVGAYVLIVPADAPVVRSAAMIGAFLIASAFGRTHDRVNTLAWIACGLVLARPADVFSPGFQLSVGVTLALIWLSPWAQRMIAEPEILGVRRTPLQRLGLWLKNATTTAISTALVAWLVSAPTVIDHTGMTGPMGFVSSLVALPLLTLTLACSYLALGVGVLAALATALLPAWISPIVATPAALLWALTEWLAGASLGVASLLDRVPGGSLNWPAVPTWWTILATASVCGVLRWGRSRPLLPAIGLALSVAYIALVVWWPGLTRDEHARRVIEIDAGRGRCVVIRGDGPGVIIVDAGSTSPSTSGAIPTLAWNATRSLGGREGAVLILTRASSDRASAAARLTSRLGVRHVLVGQDFLDVAEARPSAAPARLLRELEAAGASISVMNPGDTLALDDLRAVCVEASSGEIGVRVTVNEKEVWRTAPARQR